VATDRHGYDVAWPRYVGVRRKEPGTSFYLPHTRTAGLSIRVRPGREQEENEYGTSDGRYAHGFINS